MGCRRHRPNCRRRAEGPWVGVVPSAGSKPRCAALVGQGLERRRGPRWRRQAEEPWVGADPLGGPRVHGLAQTLLKPALLLWAYVVCWSQWVQAQRVAPAGPTLSSSTPRSLGTCVTSPVASPLRGTAATQGSGLGGRGCGEQEVGVMAGAGCGSWVYPPAARGAVGFWRCVSQGGVKLFVGLPKRWDRRESDPSKCLWGTRSLSWVLQAEAVPHV